MSIVKKLRFWIVDRWRSIDLQLAPTTSFVDLPTKKKEERSDPTTPGARLSFNVLASSLCFLCADCLSIPAQSARAGQSALALLHRSIVLIWRRPLLGAVAACCCVPDCRLAEHCTRHTPRSLDPLSIRRRCCCSLYNQYRSKPHSTPERCGTNYSRPNTRAKPQHTNFPSPKLI